MRLHFPQETGRGVAFVLEEQTGDSWALRYYLVAGTEDEGAAEWWTPDDAQGRGWEDLGVGGPGPDFIEIPETVEPGSYRVCTANAGDEFCAPIRVGS